jgi:Bacterial pre-peptidase C-terminal domain
MHPDLRKVTMNFRSTVFASTLAVLGTASLGAQAAYENLNADNSTIATAQALGSLSGGTLNVFGVRGTVNLFGLTVEDNNDVDFYSFTVGANQTLTLTVDTPDGPQQGDDPMVGLFSADGRRLAVDDDGGPGYDSLLTFTINNPGTFYAAVTGFDDFDFDGIADLFEDEGSGSSVPNTNFQYNLQISAVAVTQPVPVPAAGWLLGSALLGFARRRKLA